MHRRYARYVAPCWMALAALGLAASGCGRAQPSPVAGSVTLDRKPLADAIVSFIPLDAEATPAFARTDSSGNFALRQGRDLAGAAAGQYQVRITTYRPPVADLDPPTPTVRERVPAKYNVQTELRVQVKPGENLFRFDLDSRGPVIQPDDNVW